MAKLSKEQKRDIKAVIKRWKAMKTDGGLFVCHKKQKYKKGGLLGAFSAAMIGADVALTGGLGGLGIFALGIGMPTTLGAFAAGHERVATMWHGERLFATDATINLLYKMDWQLISKYSDLEEMTPQEREAVFDQYLAEMDGIAKDIKTLKPLYQVFNKAGKEIDEVELGLSVKSTSTYKGKTTVSDRVTLASLHKDREAAFKVKKSFKKLG